MTEDIDYFSDMLEDEALRAALRAVLEIAVRRTIDDLIKTMHEYTQKHPNATKEEMLQFIVDQVHIKEGISSVVNYDDDHRQKLEEEEKKYVDEYKKTKENY
jgi:hypothetical protein